MRHGRPRRLVLLLALVIAASTVGAWAFWTAAGAGVSAASTGALDAATISVPSSAVNSIAVTWSQQATLNPTSALNSLVTYSVERKLAGGTYAAVASGGCSGAKARGTTSCSDVPPATGSYTYRVVAAFRTWTATSAETGSVAFLLDTVAPTVLSINRADASPTNASSVSWTATFSEPVTGVGASDFLLARAGGLTGGAITGVTGSGTTYTVTASTGSGDGTLGLDLLDDDSITDAAANALGGTGSGNGNLSGQTYTVDRTPPSLVSLSALDTNADGKIDRVSATFSETLPASTATAPWTLANVPSAGSLSSVSTSGAVATLTLNAGAGAADTSVGTFTVALAASATGMRDGAGNQASFAATAPSDGAAPVRLSLTMLDNDSNGKVDRVTASFSEALAGSTLTAPWTLASVPGSATLASVSTSTTVATLLLTEGTADTAVGAFTLALATNASGIRDAAGNLASFSAAAPVDGAAPVRTAMRTADTDNNGRIDRVAVTFSETVASSTATAPWTLANIPSSGTFTAVATSGGVATLTFTEGAGAVDTVASALTVALAAGPTGIRDSTGNQASFVAATPADGAAPVRTTAMQMQDTNANGKVDSVTVTFSETLAASTATTPPWTLAAVPSSGSLLSVATSTTVATLTLTEGAGAADTTVGSFTVALAASGSGIKDASGNQSFFSATAPADAAAPAKTLMQMFDIDTDGRVDRVTATFSETLVSTTLSTQWTLLNVPGTGSLNGVSTSGAVATLALNEGLVTQSTAVGTFTLALAASATGIRDAAGNQSVFAASAPADKASPVPTAIVDSDTSTAFLNLTNGKLENNDTLSVTFSEAIATGLQTPTTITEATSGGTSTLSIPGFTNGALPMGSGDYGSIVFSATVTTANAGTTVIVEAGTCGTLCINLVQGSGTTMVYVPAPTLLDVAGNGAAGQIATGFKIF